MYVNMKGTGTRAGWRKPDRPREDWKCPSCKTQNKKWWTRCPKCSTDRP